MATYAPNSPAASGAGAGTVAWALCVVLLALVALDAKVWPLASQWLPRGWQRAARDLKRGLRRSPPEALGMAGALALVLALRGLGPSVLPRWAKSRDGADVWAEIQDEWPMLKTADTLLAMQSMLRPIAILSVLMHAPQFSGYRDSDGPWAAAISRESAMLWVVGIVARFVAFPLSGDEAYMLIGPAGGIVPVAFDVVSLTLLFCFIAGTSGRYSRAVVFVCVVLASVTAWCNNLLMSNHRPVADVSFAFAHSVELLASAGQVFHLSMAVSPISGAGRVTAVLALQQLLSAYFFANVFPLGSDEEWPQRGKGLILITGGSIVNLGLLLLGFVACAVNATDAEKHDGSATEEQPRQRRRTAGLSCGEQSQDISLRSSAGSADEPREPCEPSSSSGSPVSPSRPPPRVLELAEGVPLRCRAHVCLADAEGLMREGDELLEVLCNQGCRFVAHARCFRAGSRAVRRHCGGEGCTGQVFRFCPFGGEGAGFAAAPRQDAD